MGDYVQRRPTYSYYSPTADALDDVQQQPHEMTRSTPQQQSQQPWGGYQQQQSPQDAYGAGYSHQPVQPTSPPLLQGHTAWAHTPEDPFTPPSKERTSHGERPLAGPRASQRRRQKQQQQPLETKESWFVSVCRAFQTKNQIAWLTIIGVQAVTVLVMIALVYWKISSATAGSAVELYESNVQLTSVATYLAIFIMSQLFETYVSLDALLEKNIMQLGLLVPFELAILVYSSFLPSQLAEAVAGTAAGSTRSTIRAFAYVIIVVIAVALVCMVYLTWRLYYEMGWAVFKSIGADIQLKKMYMMYQVDLCLLKYTAFFCVSFCVQFLVLVSGTPSAEFGLTIAALPIAVVGLVLGGLCVRYESRIGTYIFMFCQLCGIGYFLYKLIRLFDPDESARYEVSQKTLTIFSVISLVMLLALFFVTGLCTLNFNRGLKQRLPPSAWRRRRLQARSPSIGGGGAPSSEHKLAVSSPGLARHDTRMSMD